MNDDTEHPPTGDLIPTAPAEPSGGGPSTPASAAPASSAEVLAPAAPRGPSVFGAALLAAMLSSILTLSASLVVFRSMVPAATSAPAASTSAAASPVPTAGAAAASTIVPGAGDPAPDSSSATVTAAARALPSVVTITTTATGRRGATLSSSGSGFIFDAAGWVLTNRHVVTGAQSVSVTLADGRTVAGQVYGASSTNDLAVIKIDQRGLGAATLGDSRRLALGQALLILGSPLGEYPNSVTSGVVSGLGRTVDVSGVERLTNLIQTDAAVNPGNSGGPVVDLAGRVVGVAVATSQAEGISFAIPIADAGPVMAAALAGQPLP